MTAPTHRLGGFAAGMAIAAGTNAALPATALIVTMAVLGSLLPDIDNRHSSISRKWRLISGIFALGQKIIRIISKALPKKAGEHIRSLIGHRGITHSLTAVLLFSALTYMIVRAVHFPMARLCAIAVAGGVASHILLDILAGGVPLLMPFSTKRICLARIKTGGLAEWCFRITIIIIFTYVGWEKFI